jgi:hypothetical protein
VFVSWPQQVPYARAHAPLHVVCTHGALALLSLSLPSALLFTISFHVGSTSCKPWHTPKYYLRP